MTEQQDLLSRFNPEVRNKIVEQSLRLGARECYRRAWMRLFTPEEREALGGDLEECWKRDRNIVRVWMNLRNCSQLRAIVELSHGLNFLTAHDYQWLLREIGESETPESQTPLPIWDAERRELRYRGIVVRRVRVGKVASSISSVLDDFQEAGWPAKIPSNLDTTLSSQPLHDAVAQLNKNLADIRFGVDGDNIFWTQK